MHTLSSSTTLLLVITLLLSSCAANISALSQEEVTTSSSTELKSLLVDLDDSNFEKTVQVTPSSSSTNLNGGPSSPSLDSWFVFFHSSSCIRCHTIMPSIEMFGTNMFQKGEHNVKVAKVDCNPRDAEIYELTKRTCKRFSIRSFPTMIYVTNHPTIPNKRVIYNYFNYRGEKVHTAASLLEFVKNPEGAILGQVNKKIKELQDKNEPVPDSLWSFKAHKPWDDDKIPKEIITWSDEFWHFVEEVNFDIRSRSKGMIHPMLFWVFVIFMVVTLSFVLIVSVFDLTPRRRKISEIRNQKQQEEMIAAKKKKQE